MTKFMRNLLKNEGAFDKWWLGHPYFSNKLTSKNIFLAKTIFFSIVFRRIPNDFSLSRFPNSVIAIEFLTNRDGLMLTVAMLVLAFLQTPNDPTSSL